MKKVIIMGAAGRDFHNFNVFFRDNKDCEVVAFTAATQIPGIANRSYPMEISHTRFDIPIFPEEYLPQLIKTYKPDEVILAYSDLSHQEVMNKASLVVSLGCDFKLMGVKNTMLKSTKPIIAVTAVRTGCGKSGVSKAIAQFIKSNGLKVVLIRHPMPYDLDLNKQVCQRFATTNDLIKYNCTIEEREEYEQYVNDGFIIYAGVDYEKILREAEKEADVIIWDGGNNDTPFFIPDYHICVVDPLRPEHELTYYPGQINVRMANMVVINKVNASSPSIVNKIVKNIELVNKNTYIIKANSITTIDKDLDFKHKVLIIEDGPTITHGEMSHGAGDFAVLDYDCEIIDPRISAIGSIKEIYEKYPHIGKVLPAMGYSPKQIAELEQTINNSNCDVVVSATPIDLNNIIKINKPIVRVLYEFVPESNFYNHIRNFLYDYYEKNKP